MAGHEEFFFEADARGGLGGKALVAGQLKKRNFILRLPLSV